MALQYQLTKQFGQGAEKIIAAFADEKHAREFMDAQVAWDHKTKVETLYRLYLHSDCIAEVNAKEYESLQSAGTQEKQSGNITPFGTTPKPPGTAPSTKKYEDFDDEQ